jgi:MYXO-CTERM domain-containing protein
MADVAEDGDGCSSECVIEDGWICDADDVDVPSICALIRCGDGHLAPEAEACDDNNTADGDGCSAVCEVEAGWSCTTNTAGSESVCQLTCGGDGGVGDGGVGDGGGGDGGIGAPNGECDDGGIDTGPDGNVAGSSGCGIGGTSGENPSWFLLVGLGLLIPRRRRARPIA